MAIVIGILLLAIWKPVYEAQFIFFSTGGWNAAAIYDLVLILQNTHGNDSQNIMMFSEHLIPLFLSFRFKKKKKVFSNILILHL